MSRKSASSDSLDLLLDTICNTFGGVLFIALLVIVLLNLSGKKAAVVPPSPAAQSKLQTAQKELAATQAELNRLRDVAAQQAEIADRLGDARLRNLVRQFKLNETTISTVTARRADQLKDSASAQVNANQIAESLQKLDQALTAARQRLAVVDQQLQAERKLRTRTVHLPRQRETQKRQVAYLLTGGRLHAYVRVAADGKLEREEGDTKVAQSPEGEFLLPVPGGGVTVTPSGDNQAPLAQKLRGFPPQDVFVTICVWPDSFAHFAPLRQYLVAQGFEYQLVPMRKDGKAVITTNAISRKVQ